MKILISADHHLNGKRREIIDAVFRQMLEQESIDYYLNAGDWFDNPLVGDSQASTGELVTMSQVFLEDLECESVLISGQHDLAFGLGRSAIAPLGNERIHVWERPQFLHFSDLVVLCMPWLYPSMLLKPDEMQELSRDEIARKFRQRVQQQLDAFRLEAQVGHDAGKPVIFLGHCQMQGCALPSGISLDASDRELVFTREQLIEIGADYYALGDIHKRQPLDESRPELGGYVGTVAQKDFGEGMCIEVPERNNRGPCEPGFEVLEVKGRTVTATHIHTDTPRYFTLGAEHYRFNQEEFRSADFVRIRDYELPDDISLNPPHLTFERIPQERKAREGAADMNVDEMPIALFGKWFQSCCPPFSPLLADPQDADLFNYVAVHDIIDDLAQDLPRENGALGSLERVSRVRLKHIGPHEDTTLTLNSNELIGIAGDNGSGKTFLIESVLACFYGEWPSRPGFYEQVTRGADGEALIEVEFVSGGETYTASRLIDAARTQQDAYLYRENETEAIAGPKVREFESAIEQLIGSKELVLATIFSSQFSAGDLTELPPRERKAVLGKLVRAERFEIIHERAKDKRSEFASKRDSLQLQQNRQQELAAKLPEIQQAIETATAERDKAADNIEQQEADIQRIREKAAALKAKYKERSELEQAVKDAGQDLLNAQKRVSLTEQKIKEVENGGEDKQRLIEALASLADTESELADIEDKLQAETLLIQTRSNLQAARKELADAEAEAALIDDPELNCDSPMKIPPCKFMDKAREAKSRIPELKRSVIEHEKALAALPDVNFEALKVMRQTLQARLKSGQQAKQRLAEIKGQEAALPELREQLADYEAEVERYQAILAEKKEAFAACDEPDETEKQLEAERDVAEQLLAQARQSHEKHVGEVAALQERIATVRQADNEVRSLKAEIEKHEILIAQYALIAEAFGKDGIPQLLIEAAVPQIQAILDDILEGQDFRVTLSTLGSTKSGKQREVLDILVSDGESEREVATFSGGERKMVKLALRLALAVYQAQREGKRMEIFIVDEAFDALDTDNRRRMVDVLKRFVSHFKQVLVVTHATPLINEFPTRVYLEKRGGGAVMEVVS